MGVLPYSDDDVNIFDYFVMESCEIEDTFVIVTFYYWDEGAGL